MNRDLEAQLEEMGPEYRKVVDRLLAGRMDLPTKTVASSPLWRRRRAAWSAAAAVALALALGAVFRDSSAPAQVYTVRASDASTEYLMAHVRGDEAVKELVRTQRSDGGWGSDFLTRQNAEALSRSRNPSARLAYRKAMRNLRLRGLAVRPMR